MVGVVVEICVVWTGRDCRIEPKFADLVLAPFQFGYFRMNETRSVRTELPFPFQLNLAKFIHCEGDLAAALVAKLALPPLIAQQHTPGHRAGIDSVSLPCVDQADFAGAGYREARIAPKPENLAVIAL